jgi:hypothetical protein
MGCEGGVPWGVCLGEVAQQRVVRLLQRVESWCQVEQDGQSVAGGSMRSCHAMVIADQG